MTTLFSIPYFTEKQNSDVRAVNGILDLQAWNPGQDGTVALKGQWKFFWKEFIDCGQSDSGGMTVQVPSFWDDYDGIDSGFGYGTYVLKVKNAEAGMPLALHISHISTAYELYIDDQLYSSGGKDKRRKGTF